jgi:[ribosomal protein S5]-alanine N-acetyltransferase
MQLTTSRLMIREPVAEDFPAVFEIFGSADVRRFEGPPQTEAEVYAALVRAIQCGQSEPRTAFRPVITYREDGRVCGTISLRLNNSEINEWEIGWMLRQADWGKGIAAEAARAVLEFAFTQLEAHRVVAFCHAGNRQSVRVMEKIGMQYEGRLRQVRWINGAWHDEFVYAIVADLW